MDNLENENFVSYEDEGEDYFEALKNNLAEINFVVAQSLDSNEQDYQDRDGTYC